MKKFLLLPLFMMAMVAVGETPAANTSTASVSPASEAKTIGSLDLRPEYTVGTKSYDIFGEASLGYQFNKDLSLSYFQWFTANLYDPTAATKGMVLGGDDGFVKFKANNLLVAGDFSIAYENRLIFPTKPGKAAAGMILEDQNRIKFIQKLDAVTLTLMEIPVYSGYTRAYYDKGGVLTATPGFENRVYFIVDWDITSNLSLSVPLLFISQRYREFAGAAKSGTWAHVLHAWPEITYGITPNARVGLAWFSNSLVSSDLSSLNLDTAFDADSQVQAIVQFTL